MLCIRSLKLLVGMVIIFGFGHSYANEAEFQLIIHGDATETNLEKLNIKKIYLGKKTTWGSGANIVVATLKSGPVHEMFLDRILSKSPKSFNKYWCKRAFSGKGSMPKQQHSEEAMVRFVKETKGAIGYVSKNTDVSGTKVVTISD